jgi:hypothetical protein
MHSKRFLAVAIMAIFMSAGTAAWVFIASLSIQIRRAGVQKKFGCRAGWQRDRMLFGADPEKSSEGHNCVGYSSA